MERKTGLEPATPTLARLCSTTELLPHLINSDIIISQFCLLSSLIFSNSIDVSLDVSATVDIVSYRSACVNRKFSFSQDFHFAVSTLAVRRRLLYTIQRHFARGFLNFLREWFRVRGSRLARGAYHPLIGYERGGASSTGSEGSEGGSAAHKNKEAPRVCMGRCPKVS